MKDLRVLVVACDGMYKRHLIQRASQAFTLCGVLLKHNPAAKGSQISRLWRYRNRGDIGLASSLFEQLVTVDGGLIESTTPHGSLSRNPWSSPHLYPLRRRRGLWAGGT